jgi:hypothetical protein
MKNKLKTKEERMEVGMKWRPCQNWFDFLLLPAIRNHDSWVGKPTRLRAGRPKNLGSIPGNGKKFVPSMGPPSFLCCFPGGETAKARSGEVKVVSATCLFLMWCLINLRDNFADVSSPRYLALWILWMQPSQQLFWP